MWRKRVKADERWADAIVEAVATFEQTAEQMVRTYQAAVDGLPTTERIDYFTEIEF
jgi:predicted Zn-dependent protease